DGIRDLCQPCKCKGRQRHRKGATNVRRLHRGSPPSKSAVKLLLSANVLRLGLAGSRLFRTRKREYSRSGNGGSRLTVAGGSGLMRRTATPAMIALLLWGLAGPGPFALGPD